MFVHSFKQMNRFLLVLVCSCILVYFVGEMIDNLTDKSSIFKISHITLVGKIFFFILIVIAHY